MTVNFLNLVKENDTRVQEVQKSPKQDKPKEVHTKILHN